LAGDPAVTITRAPSALDSWMPIVPISGGTAVDEHGLTALQVPAIDEIGPAGEQGFRYRRGLAHRQAAGIGRHLFDRSRRELGIATACQQAQTGASDGPTLNIFADRRNSGRHFQAGNVARAAAARVVTLRVAGYPGD